MTSATTRYLRMKRDLLDIMERLGKLNPNYLEGEHAKDAILLHSGLKFLMNEVYR